MTAPVRLSEEAQEVALAEAQAVRAMAVDEGYRERLAGLAAAVEDGVVEGDDALELERLLELGLQSGRVRAVYGPGGEQAALRLYRRLPGGAELVESAREVSEALAALTGRELESVRVEASGPGAFSLSISAGGSELHIRLDRQGARVASVTL
jgi:hypothetical protein